MVLCTAVSVCRADTERKLTARADSWPSQKWNKTGSVCIDVLPSFWKKVLRRLSELLPAMPGPDVKDDQVSSLDENRRAAIRSATTRHHCVFVRYSTVERNRRKEPQRLRLVNCATQVKLQ